MTADQFFVKYAGKYIDYDGYYGYQCVDLYRQFVKEVYGCQQSPPVSGAAKVWDTYNKDFFTRISNGPVNYPNRGDIVIWNTKAGGGYGHIAIAMDAGSYTFNSFDQNWPVGSRCHKQPHNYTNVLGWLTPKKKEDNIVSTGPETTTSEIPQTSLSEAVIEPTPTPETPKVEEPTGGETPVENIQDNIPVGGLSYNGSSSNNVFVESGNDTNLGVRPSITRFDIFISQTLAKIWNVLVRFLKRF